MPCFVGRFVDEHDRSVRADHQFGRPAWSQPGRTVDVTRPASSARADRLLASRCRSLVVDLTQPLSEDTPVLKLPPPFENTPRLTRHEVSRYDDRGPAWVWDCRTAAWRALAAKAPRRADRRVGSTAEELVWR